MKTTLLISLFLIFISPLGRDNEIVKVTSKTYKSRWNKEVDKTRESYLKIEFFDDHAVYTYCKDASFHSDSLYPLIRYYENDTNLFVHGDTCILTKTISFKTELGEIKIKKFLDDVSSAIDDEWYYYFIDSIGLISVSNAWDYFETIESDELTSSLVESLLNYFISIRPPLPYGDSEEIFKVDTILDIEDAIDIEGDL